MNRIIIYPGGRIFGTVTGGLASIALLGLAMLPVGCTFGPVSQEPSLPAEVRHHAQRPSSDAFPSHLVSYDQGVESMSITQPVRSSGKVEYASSDTFDELVLRSELPVLVDFYADWCGPCRMLSPVLDELARETPDVRVVKVNIDEHPELAMEYRIQSIPALAVFRNGRVTATRVGLANKNQLHDLLRR